MPEKLDLYAFFRRVPASLWLVILIGLLAGGAQLVMGRQQPGELIAELDYRIDPGRDLTAAEALAEGGWQRIDTVPNFGFRREAFWFRIEVEHPDGAPGERLLELSYPILDTVQLYHFHEGREVHRWLTGDDHAFHERPIAHRNFVFPVALEPGHNTLLLRITTAGVMQAPLTLWQPLAFIEFYETQSVIDGAYFGVMVIMVFYNLILYLGIRERPYLYYVGHVGTATLFLATMHGLAYMHLWPYSVWWQSRAVPVLVSLSVVFIALFVTSFLKIEWRSRLGRAFQGLLVLAAISTGLGFVLEYPLALKIASLLSVTALTVSLGVSIWGWLRGNRSARFLVLAWTLFVAGAIALAFNKLGLVPRTVFTESGMLFGSMLDVVLLSIAMADRVRQERLLREAAQARAMDMEQRARARLEDAVAERTEQLETAMAQLKEANRRLQDLSNLDGLTGVHNRRYFDRALEFAWLEAAERDDSLCLALIDADRFKEINDQHGHLAGDEVLKGLVGCMGRIVGRRDHVLARIGGEEFVLLLPGCSLDEGVEVAEAIRAAVADSPFAGGDAPIEVTVSIGVATRRNGDDTRADLVERADRALYRAKQDGRNRVEVARVA